MSDRSWNPARIMPAHQARHLPRWQLDPLFGALPGPAPRRPQSVEEKLAAEAALNAAREEAARLALARAEAAAATEPAPAPPPSAVDPAEVERIKSAAFDEGYAAGYDHGAAAARREAGQLQALALSAASVFDRFETDLAPRVLELAMEVARQMVLRELSQDNGVVLSVVRHAFQQLTGAETGKHLMLHPSDVQLVRAHLGDELELGHWKVVEDASLAPGGCRIDTQQSELDASVQTRWKRTLAALGLDASWNADDA